MGRQLSEVETFCPSLQRPLGRQHVANCASSNRRKPLTSAWQSAARTIGGKQPPRLRPRSDPEAAAPWRAVAKTSSRVVTCRMSGMRAFEIGVRICSTQVSRGVSCSIAARPACGVHRDKGVVVGEPSRPAASASAGAWRRHIAERRTVVEHVVPRRGDAGAAFGQLRQRQFGEPATGHRQSPADFADHRGPKTCGTRNRGRPRSTVRPGCAGTGFGRRPKKSTTMPGRFGDAQPWRRSAGDHRRVRGSVHKPSANQALPPGVVSTASSAASCASPLRQAK